jgi:hypothetical protein
VNHKFGGCSGNFSLFASMLQQATIFHFSAAGLAFDPIIEATGRNG